MQNILIDPETKEIKIIDFGFAVCSEKNERLKMFCGTPSYIAPEIANKEEYLGPAADMWSIGVLFYILLCGKYPFIAESEHDLFRKITKGYFYLPSYISNEAKSFINKFLQVDPNKRITSNEVLKDNFLNRSYAV